MPEERRGSAINTFQSSGVYRLETITDQREIFGIAKLRAKLGQKAKLEPKFRFYTLYHHICKDEILMLAWEKVKKNGGSAGIDGISIKAIERQGVSEFLKEIQTELKNKTHHYIHKNSIFL